MIQMTTSDREEAVSAVSGVYCPHDLQLDARTRSNTTRLRATSGESLAHVALEYGARAVVDAGALDGLILVMHATRGVGVVRQRSREAVWRGGQTVAVSGNQATQYTFDAMFAQSTLRLNPASVRSHCEQLLGVTLDGDVRFAVAPFPADLEALWSQILGLTVQQTALPRSGLHHLEKLAMDLLLHRCPHNYSHLFAREEKAVPRRVAEAVALVDSSEDHELLTVGDVAGRLGVSARSLERSFREAMGVSPAQYLRSKRLDRVRRQLEWPQRVSSITDVAAAYGFYHPGRFAGYYRERFGESPSATAARVTPRSLSDSG